MRPDVSSYIWAYTVVLKERPFAPAHPLRLKPSISKPLPCAELPRPPWNGDDRSPLT